MSDTAIDWDNWEYGIHATLMFIVQGDEILLIEKKRGLGAGKINGPGGKIDPGETALEAVIRETEEELCITPLEISKVGELQFEMSHVPNIRCHVYRAEGFEGTPTETDEAVPLWTKLDAIPYDRMWEDDRHWMPHLISNTTFHGRFIFEEESMQWMDMQTGVEWSE